MHKALSLVLLGLLAAIGSSALYPGSSSAPNQEVFSHVGHHVNPPPTNTSVTGIIYLTQQKFRTLSDMDSRMKEVIAKEMDFQAEIIFLPEIELIPTRHVSKEIVCSTTSCTVGLHESVSVSTTHSFEASFLVEIGAKPFGVGMSFTASLGYGYSKTNEVSTQLSYEFTTDKGDRGYIGFVNAQDLPELGSRRVRVLGRLNLMPD
ncbi:hypothetical protein BGX23_012040 [Mortierella sp. AD031]|nr:hypothetical protein BGX23_012040 [Mortierella sp. AD031]